MASKQKHEMFWFNRHDTLYPDLVAQLRRAHENSYSVVELGRYLNHKSSRNLYALMRDEGIYPRLQQKRQRAFNLPAKFQFILNSCQLSFLQWCNSHGLDPEATAQALDRDEEMANPASVSAHAAVRQDFRRAYDKVFGGSTEVSVSSRPKTDKLITDYALTIAPVPGRYTYEAYIHGLPICRVEAPNRDLAYRLLKARYVLYASIIKLKLLPKRNSGI